MPQFSVILFFGLFVVVAYAIAAYPVVLRLAARRARPVIKDGKLRSVSIIIPVWNGEHFLEAKLRSVLALNYPRELMEILVVSDGSTDRTNEIARQFAAQGVRLLHVDKGGKAAALNAGVPVTSGEILIFNDVRQTLHPESLRRLIACFASPTIGAVSARLCIRGGESNAELDSRLYWRYELWIRQQMSKVHSTWGCTGAYYGLRRTLWEPIPPEMLIDDAWLPLTALLKGFRVVLEPTAVMYDFPTELHSEFRRKVRTQAGLFQMLWTLPGLFSEKNPMRFHFLSNKYCRLIVPWCLLGMAGAALGMREPARTIALAGQAILYFIALIDLIVPPRFAVKKVTSPIRTFIILMAAAFLAIRVFFVPARSLWKETVARQPAPAVAE
jgi:cellulose synthase/poly-beta-1,6-N-acetylglucosamine synthase-like glycosyltransferase